MKAKKENKSLSKILSRRISYYPSPRTHSIFVAMCFDEERKKAELTKDIVSDFVKKIPENKQVQLLALYKEMSAEERQYPHKMAKQRK